MIAERYPKTSRFFFRSKYIIQEIIVIFALITMTFVETNKQPSIIGWGFVILCFVFLGIILGGDTSKKTNENCA